MSIWSDQAVKELQEKVAWLEKEIEQLKASIKAAGPTKPSTLSLGKGKPS